MLAISVAGLARAQQLLPLAFPDTDKTSVTDCLTPTTLNVPGGGTATFRGGQFIHYEDENFYGTIYATNSAAGCVSMGPDFGNDFDGSPPITQASVTFSKEVPNVSFQTYNLLGPQGMWDGPNPGMILVFRDGSGNTTGAYGRGFPSHLMNPDRQPYPIAGLPWPPITQVSFYTSDAPKPDQNFAPVATDWFWGITSIWIPQNPIEVTGEILDGSAGETKKNVASDQTIYAQVPLGLELRLGVKRGGVYLPAKYELAPATLNGTATPTLYPTNVVLEYNRAQHEGQKTFRGVHLGTQKLTVTPDDTSVKPLTFTLGVFDPGSLGDSDIQYDSQIVNWGNRRGIPPHIVKGLIKKETGRFDPNTYRYEPLNPETGDIGLSVNDALLDDEPYVHYRMATADGDSRGDLQLGDDVQPRHVLMVPRGPNKSLIELRPTDVCPNACVSAQELVLANDDVQHWTDHADFDIADPTDLARITFTAQTPLAASYGLMQTMYEVAAELKWSTFGGQKNPSLLFDTAANVAAGGGSLAVGTHEFYKRYRLCRSGDFATDPDFADSDAYKSMIIDALNYYNHGPNSKKTNANYGDEAWALAEQYKPAHPLSKIFP
jgi:hypothetical protein